MFEFFQKGKEKVQQQVKYSDSNISYMFMQKIQTRGVEDIYFLKKKKGILSFHKPQNFVLSE